MPTLAQSKLRLEISPMTRPACPTVIPGVLRTVFLSSDSGQENKRADDQPRGKVRHSRCTAI
jgi:hypothetical protein